MKKIEQIEMRENGNNGSILPPKQSKKQGTQCLKWCFTTNNYTKEQIERIEQSLDLLTKKYVFQEEKGENGTPHLQGCFWLKKRMRITELNKYPGMDKTFFEKLRNWKASVEYCRKTETRAGKVYCKGIPRPIKILPDNKLYDWEKDIISIVKNEPDDRKIYWIYETTGNVGKSTFCKYLCVKHNALILGGKANDMKYGIVKYMEKNGEYPRTIIADIPRTNKKFISYQGLEEVKNACFFSGKYEGNMVIGNNPHLIIFANFPPDKSKMSKDRWVVKCIGDDKYSLSDCESD